MTRIGLISDTHNYLDDAIFNYLNNCDEIWHAGDFGSIEIAEKLNSFLTSQNKSQLLKGVYGNIDEPDIKNVYPETLRWKCENVNVMMKHIGGYPPKYNPSIKKDLTANPPQLFISGHSHILKIMFDKNLQCLHINPGAAGKQGWHKVRTLVRFCIDKDDINDCEVVEL